MNGKRASTPSTLRDKLLEFGISEQQADSLVDIVGVIRFVLRERRKRQSGGQTLEAQREALLAMSEALDAAIEAAGKADNLIDPAGLGMVLRERLDATCGNQAGDRIRALLDAAHGLRPVVRMALQGMPKGQTRDRAPTTPIRLIHERSGLKPSTAETSAFRRITVLLYEAAGFPHANPDAAIREYSKRQKDLIAGP